jgi:TonB family protein
VKPVEQPKVIEQPKPEPIPEPVQEAAPEDEFDLPSDEPEGDPNGMDLPGLSALRPVGDLEMDPLMQVYLEQLQRILMQNFSPPSGVAIGKSEKTSIQFTIQRNGQITGVMMKRSSGNGTWDRLATRAVTIARLPPLPPNYRAPFLPLVFDFKEK